MSRTQPSEALVSSDSQVAVELERWGIVEFRRETRREQLRRSLFRLGAPEHFQGTQQQVEGPGNGRCERLARKAAAVEFRARAVCRDSTRPGWTFSGVVEAACSAPPCRSCAAWKHDSRWISPILQDRHSPSMAAASRCGWRCRFRDAPSESSASHSGSASRGRDRAPAGPTRRPAPSKSRRRSKTMRRRAAKGGPLRAADVAEVEPLPGSDRPSTWVEQFIEFAVNMRRASSASGTPERSMSARSSSNTVRRARGRRRRRSGPASTGDPVADDRLARLHRAAGHKAAE